MNFARTLEKTCRATTTELFATLATLGFTVVKKQVETKTRKRKKTRELRRYAYRMGKHACSPMVVCHADTVEHGGELGHKFSINRKKNTVQSIALDDRLGIACMIYAIQNGTWMADCSMLVCDEEEIGNSSASVFAADVADTGLEPNWLVELDRRGTDAVMYDYESPILESLLKAAGFPIGSGSFSDICYLDDLGVCGFNIGIGYHREHTKDCHADLNDTHTQLDRLKKFYDRLHDVRLEHDPSYSDSYTSSYSAPSYYSSKSFPMNDYRDDDAPVWSTWGSSRSMELEDVYGDTMTVNEIKDTIEDENWDFFVEWIDEHYVTGTRDQYYTDDVKDFCRQFNLDCEVA